MKKYLKIFSKKKPTLWQPELTNNEISQINYEQAKFIYENAKNVLKDTLDSNKSLHSKADSIFKYTLSIQSGLIGLFVFKQDVINLNIETLILLSVSLIPSIIYLKDFLTPTEYKSADNPPKNTIKPIALEEMKTFYLLEAIDMQISAIPYNENANSKKAKQLKTMSTFAILSILLIFYICFSGGNSIVTIILNTLSC